MADINDVIEESRKLTQKILGNPDKLATSMLSSAQSRIDRKVAEEMALLRESPEQKAQREQNDREALANLEADIQSLKKRQEDHRANERKLKRDRESRKLCGYCGKKLNFFALKFRGYCKIHWHEDYGLQVAGISSTAEEQREWGILSTDEFNSIIREIKRIEEDIKYGRYKTKII